MKDIVKLIIVLWIVKKFFFDSQTADQLTAKIKEKIKDFLK